MRPRRDLLAALAAALGLAGCAAGPPLPPPPAHANGQALWRIVHDQCVPDQQAHGDPAPCAEVSLSPGSAGGYVLLKDRNGVAQHLLIPTAKVTGIEDPALLATDTPNYFASAWAARRLVEARLGGPIPRDGLMVAVNSAYGRSQDQLHLHIDCVSPEVRVILRSRPLTPDGLWRGRLAIAGHGYLSMWLDGAELAADPFRRLAQGPFGAAREMGAWTLALVGAGDAQRPGFWLLAERADPARGETASAERLQDHACRSQLAALTTGGR
jgi:CDP-diacylglycerol pyrophosphatase